METRTRGAGQRMSGRERENGNGREGAEEGGAARAPGRDLQDPSLYINRELSWLEFNWMVLEEAADRRHPLLERAKFLAIFANNLDEFFMIRVSGLRRQLAAGGAEMPPDGMTPGEQLAAIRREVDRHLGEAARIWSEQIEPQLAAEGIRILDDADLSEEQRTRLRRYFDREIFSTLTPLAIDPSHPFPHVSNLSLNLAVVVEDPDGVERLARLKIPSLFPRLLRVPDEGPGETIAELGLEARRGIDLVWLEQVVAANLDRLFPGLRVKAAYPWRVTRDADFEIQEDEASDLLETIEESVEMRAFGKSVHLEVGPEMPERIRDLLARNLEIPAHLVHTLLAPLGLSALFELVRLDRSDLKDPPFVPRVAPPFVRRDSIFNAIRDRDVLVYHPYDSFTPVVDFVREAATDTGVLAIKQTLYRVDQDSQVIEELLQARSEGKQVAVLVELKARFDEENNIVWARKLERAGVHVAYGLIGLKTHAKMCLVVRKERSGIVRYVHLSTGNYNAVTSRVYADLGFFTSDPEIAADVSDLFNALTGYSRKTDYRKLLVAPSGIRGELLRRIDREIERHREHGDGLIRLKMNALVDRPCIQALYRASMAGVQVDLQIRGICCLRPGIPGLSDNIRVTAIVGRFLEHSRIFHFHNGGEDEVLLGSADLMPRNLDRRVEVLFPVEQADLKERLLDMLSLHLRDTVNARVLAPDGQYRRLAAVEGETLDSQAALLP